MTCGLAVCQSARWDRQRCNADQLAGSSGTGCGRAPSRIAHNSISMCWQRRSRTSWLDAPCSKASRPTSASCGCTPQSVIHRLNSSRCWVGSDHAASSGNTSHGHSGGAVHHMRNRPVVDPWAVLAVNTTRTIRSRPSDSRACRIVGSAAGGRADRLGADTFCTKRHSGCAVYGRTRCIAANTGHIDPWA